MLKRKTPLRTKTALRAKNALKTKTILKRMTPLKATGKRHARRAPFMAQCRDAVMHRAAVMYQLSGQGILYVRCEECQRILPAEQAEWHHVFGRSLGVAGKSNWCHVKELTLALCAVCHESITNPGSLTDYGKVARTNHLAAFRLGARFGLNRSRVQSAVTTSGVRAWVVRLVESADGQPTEP